MRFGTRFYIIIVSHVARVGNTQLFHRHVGKRKADCFFKLFERRFYLISDFAARKIYAIDVLCTLVNRRFEEFFSYPQASIRRERNR